MGKNSNISDEDILKEETQPGVVVYRSNVPKGAGVFDMDIAPGIKEVTIKYDLLMLGCEKSFPDVEKLIIGEDVVSIEILNTLFPNVRWVLSMNYEFETGSYLVYNHFGFKTLLNAFCRGADETIDLGDIDSIDNFAFKGCESLNIIGGEDIKDWQAIEQDAFSESALKSQPFKNGIKKAGHIIVDIDYTADEIDIPDDRLKKIVFSSDIDFTKIKKLIIHRPETVEQINYQCGFPDTLVLNTDLLMHEQDVAGVAHFCTSKTYIKNFSVLSPEFKEIDGIAYTMNGKKLVACSMGKEHVIIPDGVKTIGKYAFANCHVKSVIIPDSVTEISESAFSSCSNLETVIFGKNVESIGDKAFGACVNLKSVTLPESIRLRVDYNMFPDKNGKRTDVWLLNTFCKKPDEVINLKSVEFIDGYAFYGCRSTKIINEDCVKGGFKLAFFGSAFMELEPVGGAYMAGSMIIDVDKDAKELVIPETATYFLHNIHNVTFIRELCKSYDKIIVKNSSLFFQRVLYAYAAPKNLVIDCEVYDDKEDFCNYIKNCSNLQNIQITDKSERYMTYDGVLYDKAGKTLLACPKNRHGTVKIKEGTKEIEKNAFFGSEVEGIEMPDSVKSLEKAVFFNCRKLQKVKLSNSLTEIPNSCFDSNISLREIVIPDSVSTIGPYAFCSSGLENIHLGKCIKIIQYNALMNTKLKELRFPASVKELQNIGPVHASDVYLESSNIPSYFCSSVSETIKFACDFDTLHKADSLAQPYVKVHTPKRTVYFPSHILIDTRNELSNFIEAKNDFPENMFPYAINARVRFQIALAECKDLKSMAAEKYLRGNIVDGVREFVNINEEAALVDLFRMHLVDDVEAFNEILQILPNSMTLAKEPAASY